VIALAEALLEMPMISSLDLRDNRVTDDVRLAFFISFSIEKERVKTNKLALLKYTGCKSFAGSITLTNYSCKSSYKK
jgi:hypothetical protein